MQRSLFKLLIPEIVNKEWTNEEDECLISNYILNQFQFSLTKKNFPGRSEIAIKNRLERLKKEFMSFLRPINQQISHIPNNNLNLSNISDLQNDLNQFNSSKEKCIKSIINDNAKIINSYKKKNIIQSFINNNTNIPNNNYSIPQNDENEFNILYSESDYFDFQNLYDTDGE